MDEFLGRYRNISVLLAVVFAQVILLGYQVRSDQGSSLLREWTVRTVTPITKSIRGLTQWAGSGWENYVWLIDTKQNNDRLNRQLEQLKLENAGLRSSLARFEREERLIAYQQEIASQTILAQVIGRGANSNSREIFISRGLDAGVTAGMPVITPDGIIGKVQASYPSAALVMLISDPEAGVGVLLERSRAGGILKGTGHRECRLDYISHEVDVAIGEAVYTSGDDRVFPKGLRIGEVVKLDRATDFQEIHVRPFARLDRLEEVLVITAGVHGDLPDSPQAQPPQFLMPLPEQENPLRTGGEQAQPGPETEAAASLPDPRNLEQSGRVTDADRLRQYYQSIAAQQGHRIGYGGPGTFPEFNPEQIRAKPQRPAPAAAPAEGPAAGPEAPQPRPETASTEPASPPAATTAPGVVADPGPGASAGRPARPAAALPQTPAGDGPAAGAPATGAAGDPPVQP